MRFLVLFTILLVSEQCYAADTSGCTKLLNEKYSFKDFGGQSFTSLDPTEFNDTCIKGSNFYQEAKEDDSDVMKSIFPAGMTSVEFVRCNLDNVAVPVGNTLLTTGSEKSTNLAIKVQNDLEDWILGVDGKPKEPLNKEAFIEAQLSTDPKKIPIEKKERPATHEKMEESSISVIP